MPIHEFKCKDCGTRFEYLCLRSSDKDNACCPSCGHRKAELLLSVFSSKTSAESRSSGSALASRSPAGGFS